MGTNAKENKKAAALTTFMLSQDFLSEHWDWTAEGLQALAACRGTDDETRVVGKIIYDRLKNNDVDITAAYAITHNQCEHELWSDFHNCYITSFVSHHIHFVARLGKGETLERLAAIIGVTPNFIEKPQRGRWAYDNMLAYLIHIKYPQKWHYKFSEVVTFVGTDYGKIYSERHRDWTHGRAVKLVEETQATLKDVEMLIMEGRLSKKELVTNPKYMYVCQKNWKTLENLYDNRRQYLLAQKSAALGKLEADDHFLKFYGNPSIATEDAEV